MRLVLRGGLSGKSYCSFFVHYAVLVDLFHLSPSDCPWSSLDTDILVWFPASSTVHINISQGSKPGKMKGLRGEGDVVRLMEDDFSILGRLTGTADGAPTISTMSRVLLFTQINR